MSVILDASAVLAMIFDERGADEVLAAGRGAYVSAVNLDEILHKCARRGMAGARIVELLEKLRVTFIPFDAEQAQISARFHPLVHGKDISFADRACFALAEHTGRAALTADSDWLKLDLALDIRLIR